MKTTRKWLGLLLTAMLVLSSLAAVAEEAPFAYEHDPRENPTAMRDIVENPEAVYGFSPSPAEESTLKEYADAIDWTDAEQVAAAREQRQAYHDSMDELYDMILSMVAEDQDIETIARAVSQRRNELRLEAYADDPEGLETVKQRNLETYGHEEGPTPDELFEKYGAWETVLLKALGTNPGMDACLGFYDEFYYLYDLETEDTAPTDEDMALFDELVEANSISEVLKRHSSKRVTSVLYNDDDEEIYRFASYANAEQYAQEGADGTGRLLMDGLNLWAMTDENGPYLGEVFYDREEAYRELLATRQEVASLDVEGETVTEVAELDGCWYITTEDHDADWIRQNLENDAEILGDEAPYAYEDGMSFVYTYVFDQETKDQLETGVVLREADGTQHFYQLDTFAYDEAYDVSSSPFAPYFEAEEFGTIHLVFAPGTPEESTMTYELPKENVHWALEYHGEYYEGDFYTDPDCTQVYEGGDKSDEVTLYIPAQEVK